MRFAISLLTLICIASVIGTVLKQNEPATNYVNQFGPFWADLFGRLGLYSVYSAWWFLLILAFLVMSTSLCITRKAPKIFTDLREFKEHLRVQSLQAFAHRAEWAERPADGQNQAQRFAGDLARKGWKVRIQARADERGWMVAAKAGAANKLGYLAAHSAIVLVCVGGLLDGDLMVRAQLWFNGKSIYTGGGLISDVKPEHRLSDRNPTFRGNLMVGEGTQSSTAILSQSSGILVQDLPFAVELKKFVVEHYSTGMPKLFASDIVIHDKETGEKREARVEVNHPVHHKGIAIFQSSFDDGGSSLKLKAWPMGVGSKAFEVEGVVGGSTQLARGPGPDAEKMTLEFTGLRTINVENLGATGQSGTDVRAVNLMESVQSRLGAANKTQTRKDQRNVGPSVTYKLRDASGQAREFHNYMLPVDTGDGVPVMLLGVRQTPAEPFRYLRVPADDQGGMQEFVRLRSAMDDASMRQKAVDRYAHRSVEGGRKDLADALGQSAGRALDLFAGQLKTPGRETPQSGLQAVADFLDNTVPESDRPKAGEMLIRILTGVLLELLQISREQAQLPALPVADNTQAYLTQLLLALSDAFVYPAPMVFLLDDFKQVQASVFQVARAPGQSIVYLGCALLILGVFAMLYVRERRLWIWVAETQPGQIRIQMALSTNRKTLDTDREFDHLRQVVERGLQPHRL